MYIEKINGPQDVKKLSLDELNALASEMRDALLHRASVHGGHFGPNFGIVEATIALHYVFDSPQDKFVFDVSHQSYPHKILTGRKEAYIAQEHYDDVTGYTSPIESEHDMFTVGHTSTSVSLACGLARGRDVTNGKGNVIALIGDGSISGGEALEGFNVAGEMGSNLIIVANDNQMSIAENHGGLYKNLKLLRDTDGKAECNLFKSMGLDYVYVKDGNNIEELIKAFKSVKDIDHPVVVHINTLKGKGYKPAETDKESWHWCMPFDIETGKATVNFPDEEDYSSITTDYLRNKMKSDKSVVAITAGTPALYGFTPDERKAFGRQFLDVGIAEQTAVAMASAIAKNGGKPVFNVYSSFIQRTYDQLSQDLCIDSNPATILVQTASVNGMTDVTHLGIFDIPMISNIPNLVYIAPTTKEDYLAVLDWSIEQTDYPVAIRVPVAELVSTGKPCTKNFAELNKYEVAQQGGKIAVIALGSFYGMGEQAAKLIEEKTGTAPTLINPYYITGVDTELLESLKKDHDVVVTLEDGVLDGGFGEKIARFYGPSDVKVINFGLKKEFLDRYNPADVLKENRLTPEQIAEDAVALI